MGTELTTNLQESQFYAEIKELLLQARSRAYMAVNSIMSQTYWQIGKRIVEQEQKGSSRAEYGSRLIKRLAQSLAADFGDGLSVANLKNFRRFYLTYPDQEKSYTLCSLLSWSHIRLIMRCDDELERQYYISESSKHNWSVRTLERNLKTDSFHRLISQSSLTEHKEPLAQHDIVKDPYVMEFLGIKGNGKFLESELEDTGSDRVIDLNTPFVQKHNLLETQKPFAISRIASSDGGSGELRNVFFDEVVVGKYHLPLVAGAFSTLTSGMQSKEDIDCMIGNNFLKRFNMVMDFKNNKLFLKPNKFLYSPFYDFLLP